MPCFSFWEEEVLNPNWRKYWLSTTLVWQDTELSVVFCGLEAATENREGHDKRCSKWFERNTNQILESKLALLFSFIGQQKFDSSAKGIPTVVEIGAVVGAWEVRILHCRVETFIWNALSKVLRSDVPINYVIAASQLLLQKLFLLHLLNHKKEDCGLAFRAYSDTV